MLGPGEQDLLATLGDILSTEISRVDAAGVDVVARGRGGGFVEDLLVGPGVEEDFRYVVIVGINVVLQFGGVGREDGVGGLQVAVVEGVVGVWGEVDHDEGLVVRGVEEVQVHDGVFDQVGGGDFRQLAQGPGGAGPVLELVELSVSKGRKIVDGGRYRTESLSATLDGTVRATRTP